MLLGADLIKGTCEQWSGSRGDRESCEADGQEPLWYLINLLEKKLNWI